MQFKITDIHPISTLYYIKDYFIYYHDLLNDKIQPIGVDFDCLGTLFVQQNRLYSKAVEDLIPICLDELPRIYHLAGIVQRKHPVIPWSWNKQLFDAEKRARANRLTMEYLLYKGKSTKSPTVNLSNLDTNFYLGCRNCEPEELLWERVNEQLRKWVYP